MRDTESPRRGETPYECFECGHVIVAADDPGTCPECGGSTRNRLTPLE